MLAGTQRWFCHTPGPDWRHSPAVDRRGGEANDVVSIEVRVETEGSPMTKTEIGTLEQVSVRSVWPKEAGDFTPWLAENVELVSDALEMDLELEGQEVSVGSYSADLVLRRVPSGTLVVVENMYGSTDHDHIGKLITYAAGLGAHYAVLLTEDLRLEHRSALNWLNSISKEDCGFFGLGLEVWRIGESIPAPRLRVYVQPDNWSKSVRESPDREDSERDQLHRRFWAGVQSRFREDRMDWAGRGQPSKEHWMTFKSRRDVSFTVAFCRLEGTRRLRVEAYVDTGEADRTADVYSYLESRRDEIEEAFGEALEWSPLEKRRASRVSSYFPKPIAINDEGLWPEAQEWAVPTLGRLRAAIDPVLDDLYGG